MTFIRDISLLIARVLLGGVLFAHGWQKHNDWTIAGTQEAFQGMGVPSPDIAAQIATYFEMAGGVLLVLGLLVRFVGPILAVQMAGAFWFAHRGTEVFVDNGGWELVAVLAAGGLALAGAGAGRISLDYLFTAPFRKRKENKAAVAGAGAGAGATAAPAGTTPAGTAPAQDNFGQDTYGQTNYGQTNYGQDYSSDAPTTAFPASPNDTATNTATNKDLPKKDR